MAWQLVYVFSTFFSLNKILRLQPVILHFFSLRIRFSDQNLYARSLHSFSTYFILCYFGGLCALHLVRCLVSICIPLLCFEFPLVLAFANAPYFHQAYNFYRLFVFMSIFEYANFVHRFFISILWLLHYMFG